MARFSIKALFAVVAMVLLLGTAFAEGKTLIVRGNLRGSENTYVQVALDVVIPSLQASSSTGVTNWMDEAILGTGGPTSSLFQVLWAGPDGSIDPPTASGAATSEPRVPGRLG